MNGNFDDTMNDKKAYEIYYNSVRTIIQHLNVLYQMGGNPFVLKNIYAYIIELEEELFEQNKKISKKDKLNIEANIQLNLLKTSLGIAKDATDRGN